MNIEIFFFIFQITLRSVVSSPFFCHGMVIWTWFYIRLIGVNMFNERYTIKWRDKGPFLFTFLSSMAQKKAAYMGSCMKNVFLFWSRWMKNLYTLEFRIKMDEEFVYVVFNGSLWKPTLLCNDVQEK